MNDSEMYKNQMTSNSWQFGTDMVEKFDDEQNNNINNYYYFVHHQIFLLKAIFNYHYY